jgi:hypothetical protein
MVTSLERNQAERQTTDEKIESPLVCDYCGKGIEGKNFFQYSPTGGKYCNENCFYFYTED